MQFSFFIECLVILSGGTALTVALTIFSLAIGLALSVPLALMRASPRPFLSLPVLAYTYAFRGTPLLVQLFLVYYGLGQIGFIRHSFAWTVLREPFWCAIVAFSLNSCAYTTEILRGAIRAIPNGISEAASSLGLSKVQRLRLIVLPLAFRIALPSYGNEIIGMLKASSLASTITLLEITGHARQLVSETFAPYGVFLVAGLLYLTLTFFASMVIRKLEHHLSRATRALEPGLRSRARGLLRRLSQNRRPSNYRG